MVHGIEKRKNRAGIYRHELVQRAFGLVGRGWVLDGVCLLGVGGSRRRGIKVSEVVAVARRVAKAEERRWNVGQVDKSISP